MATAQVKVPSYNRVEPGSRPLPAAAYPRASDSPPLDAEKVASEWISTFNKVIGSDDVSALSKLFLRESFWRDQLCLTWDYHTLQGPEKLASFIKSQKKGCRLKSVSIDHSSQHLEPTVSPVDFPGEIKCIQTFLHVETDVGRGRGLVRLLQDPQDGDKWKAFTLFTTMHELKNHEESVDARRPVGVEHGGNPGRKNWMERRTAEENFEDGREPTVLIIGAYGGRRFLHLLMRGHRRCWSRRPDCCSSTQAVGRSHSGD